jgi:hypothetical protein
VTMAKRANPIRFRSMSASFREQVTAQYGLRFK